MSDEFSNLLEAVEIARVGTWAGLRMTARSLIETFDNWVTSDSDDLVSVQVGHDDNAERCGEVVALDYCDGSLFADFAVDDKTVNSIRDGALTGISIDNTDRELRHIALLAEKGAVADLPSLKSYLSMESTNMTRQDFGGFKADSVRAYTAMTPAQASEQLAALARAYQLENPGVHISVDQAVAAVRQTPEGDRLFQLWGGHTAPLQIRGFGMQSRRQENAIQAKGVAAREIDSRARRFAAGAGVTYAQAVSAVLATDEDLRRAYEGA